MTGIQGRLTVYLFYQNEFIKWWSSQATGSKDNDSVFAAVDERLRVIAAHGREQYDVDIHKAAWEGNLGVINRFLELDNNLLNAQDQTEFGVS